MFGLGSPNNTCKYLKIRERSVFKENYSVNKIRKTVDLSFVIFLYTSATHKVMTSIVAMHFFFLAGFRRKPTVTMWFN